MNKKLLALASATAITFASSQALAKTEGNYVGLDILATQYKIGSDKSTDVGVGINYKHAINFNGLFIAPGIFYNYNNSSVKEQDAKLESSYGAKIDLGYDVTDQIAPFVTVGLQSVRFDYSGNADIADSFLYGIGAKYSVTEDVDVSLAYEYTDYREDEFKEEKTQLIKLGVAYNF